MNTCPDKDMTGLPSITVRGILKAAGRDLTGRHRLGDLSHGETEIFLPS